MEESTLNKRRYDSDLAKEIIAKKAIELFSLKGYTRTSIDNIAKASGYSKDIYIIIIKIKKNYLFI